MGKRLGIIDLYPEGHLSADKQMAGGKGIKPPRGVKVVAWVCLVGRHMSVNSEYVFRTPSSRFHLLYGRCGAEFVGRLLH